MDLLKCKGVYPGIMAVQRCWFFHQERSGSESQSWYGPFLTFDSERAVHFWFLFSCMPAVTLKATYFIHTTFIDHIHCINQCAWNQ